MSVNDKISGYVREFLSSRVPAPDSQTIDNFLLDPKFISFVGALDRRLLQHFQEFTARQITPIKTLQFEQLESSNPALQTSVKPSVNTVVASQDSIAPPMNPESVKDSPDVNIFPPSKTQLSASADVAQAAPSHFYSDHEDLRFIIHNARADDAYSCQITLENGQNRAFQLNNFTMPDGVPLHCDLMQAKIEGTPTTAGEFTILLEYQIIGDARVRQAKLRFVVTPNPKSMWKNLPSDQNDPYWKPDEDKQFIRGAQFDLLAASKRGRSHAHVGSFRDDDFRFAHLDDSGWCVAIVSDGAGSCTYSRRGSQIICETALARIRQSLESEHAQVIAQAAENYSIANAENTDTAKIEQARVSLRNALYATVCHAAHFAVVAIAEEIKQRPELQAKAKDYSSTALIAICKKFPFGTLCAAYWVGDGAVGIYSQSKGITLLGAVDSGEFSGQTRFLDTSEVTAQALVDRLRFELVEDMSALVLMSDGVSDPKFETEARLARASDWDELWRDLNAAVTIAHDDETDEKAQKLLSWLDFWSQGNHDDRTIALIY